MRALADLRFRVLLAPRMLALAYPLGVLAIVSGAVIFTVGQPDLKVRVATGAVAFLALVAWRCVLEVAMTYFRIAENLAALRELGGLPDHRYQVSPLSRPPAPPRPEAADFWDTTPPGS